MSQPELKEGIHFYINEDGYIVLTEKYHLEKGFCCGMGAYIAHINTRMWKNRTVQFCLITEISKKINHFYLVEH